MNIERIHPSVEQVLIRAKKLAGPDVNIDPLDCFRRLRRLEDLARSMETPPAKELCADIDAPITVSGVNLFVPSPAAIELIERIEDMDSNYRGLAVAYVLSLGRDVTALRAMFGMLDKEIIIAARAWSRGIPCSWEALREACAWILEREDNDAEKTDGPRQPRNWSALVSALMVEYAGTDEEHWMFGVSHEQISERVSSLNRKNEEDAAQRAIDRGYKIAPNAMSHKSKMQRRFFAEAESFSKWYADKASKVKK